MKNIALILLVFSTLITSCDRDTLKGLNLKINAEVKSDYDETANPEKEKISIEEQNTIETKKSPEVEANNIESKPTTVKKVRQVADPDAPIAFKEIKDCSEAAIRAKTNEKFYGDNSQLKSIDSKNKKQVKEWEKIYQEMEKACN